MNFKAVCILKSKGFYNYLILGEQYELKRLYDNSNHEPLVIFHKTEYVGSIFSDEFSTYFKSIEEIRNEKIDKILT